MISRRGTNNDLRKRPQNDPRTSRRTSGPLSTRRNALVSTRDPVVGPDGLKRTCGNHSNPLYKAPYQNFQLKIGPLGAQTCRLEPGPGRLTRAHGIPEGRVNRQGASEKGLAGVIGVYYSVYLTDLHKFLRSARSYYGQFMTFWSSRLSSQGSS